MRQLGQLHNVDSPCVLHNVFRFSSLLFSLGCMSLVYTENAYGNEVIGVTPAPLSAEQSAAPALDASQLQELVGPIALYPDDLLALVLAAAAHPVQAISAARRVKEQRDTKTTIDYEPDWHPSVVALTHYPQVLERFDQDLQWTQRMHQAVQKQNAGILKAIQSFRRIATETQNLSSTEHVIVDHAADFIRIRQRHPDIVYVPDYRPQDVVVVHQAPRYKIIHRTRHQPVIYRHYDRFDPHYGHRDPFWYDPFWKDPLWGLNGRVFLSWRDGHPARAKRHAKNRRHKKHKNRHRKPTSSHRALDFETARSAPKPKPNGHRLKTLKTNNDRNHRTPRRHHSVNAFNHPMFENRKGASPRQHSRELTQPKTRPAPKTARTDQRDDRTKKQRRYTPDKKPIMHSGRRSGIPSHIK